MESLKSKFIGCLVGSAIGDALGRGFEGHWLSDTFDQEFTGRWTDDTHMMIGVTESLIEMKGFNGEHMARVFMRNYEMEPWRGYASGPPSVFRMIKSGVPWDEAAKRLFSGAGSYGNGAAMRVAPVGLLFYHDMEKLREVAEAQGKITHAHELGLEGAALQAYAVALALQADRSFDLDPHLFLTNLRNFVRHEIYQFKLRKVEELLNCEDRRRVVRELGHGIEAFNSVPTAIYSFLRHSQSFQDAVLYAINLGGDADTIGAMTGAVSGAYHGAEAIPERWKNRLERKDYIEKLAEKLWETLKLFDSP